MMDSQQHLSFPIGRIGIEAVLPHRAPFLFLDEVHSCEVGRYTRATKRIDADMDFFRGHFPGMPVMPGVLQLEAIAQAGAFAVLCVPRYAGHIALFAAADGVRFRRPVLPGDILELEVTIERLSAMGGKGHGTARVDGQISCEANLLFTLTEPEKAQAGNGHV